MSTEQFRDFVRSSISKDAQFDSNIGFSIRMTYDRYLASSRLMLATISGQTGENYYSEYDFNLKKASFYPASFS